jgi:uncharacterized protein YndB with AHSA1/START domain
MEQWLMRSDFKPVEGHRFRFIFTPKEGSNYEGTIIGEVLEVRPCTKLAYSWDGQIASGGRQFNSVVVWTLVPKEGGTELQLQHTGFTVLEDILTHSSGWDFCVKRMQESLNKIQHDNPNA